MYKYPVSEWGKLQDKRILKRNQEEIKASKKIIESEQKNIDDLRKQSREILYRD